MNGFIFNFRLILLVSFLISNFAAFGSIHIKKFKMRNDETYEIHRNRSTKMVSLYKGVSQIAKGYKSIHPLNGADGFFGHSRLGSAVLALDGKVLYETANDLYCFDYLGKDAIHKSTKRRFGSQIKCDEHFEDGGYTSTVIDLNSIKGNDIGPLLEERERLKEPHYFEHGDYNGGSVSFRFFRHKHASYLVRDGKVLTQGFLRIDQVNGPYNDFFIGLNRSGKKVVFDAIQGDIKEYSEYHLKCTNPAKNIIRCFSKEWRDVPFTYTHEQYVAWKSPIELELEKQKTTFFNEFQSCRYDIHFKHDDINLSCEEARRIERFGFAYRGTKILTLKQNIKIESTWDSITLKIMAGKKSWPDFKLPMSLIFSDEDDRSGTNHYYSEFIPIHLPWVFSKKSKVKDYKNDIESAIENIPGDVIEINYRANEVYEDPSVSIAEPSQK